MKILYIDPEIHTPNSRIYEHYNYLFDQVAQKAECFVYRGTQFDSILTPLNTARAAGFEPDVIFFGMGWFALPEIVFSKNLQTRDIDIPCVGFLYKPQNFLDKKIEFLKSNNFDLVVTSVPAAYPIETFPEPPATLASELPTETKELEPIAVL